MPWDAYVGAGRMVHVDAGVATLVGYRGIRASPSLVDTRDPLPFHCLGQFLIRFVPARVSPVP